MRPEPGIVEREPGPPGPREAAVVQSGRIVGSTRRPLGMVALVGAFLAVAIVRPWSSGEPAVPVPTAQPQPSATVPATPRPTPDPARVFCYEPSGWRVTAVFLWGDRTVQSWQLMNPVVASGPLDPAIVYQPFISTRVKYLGWCAPSVGDELPAETLRVRAWRVGVTGRPIALRDVHAGSAGARLGGLYTSPTGAADPWAPGRYVFELSGPKHEMWFGAEVVQFPAGEPAVPGIAPPSG